MSFRTIVINLTELGLFAMDSPIRFLLVPRRKDIGEVADRRREVSRLYKKGITIQLSLFSNVENKN